jgi:hypothetical protein
MAHKSRVAIICAALIVAAACHQQASNKTPTTTRAPRQRWQQIVMKVSA